MCTKRRNVRSKPNRAIDQQLPILDRLRTSLRLPALPPVASRILKMCQNKETTVEQLSTLMSRDPAVVARLLQIANSSYYGGSRHKITSIAQAVTLLGMNAVGSLAFSFCFYRLFRDMNRPGCAGIDHVKFWRRSIMASIAGRALGHWSKAADPELIFLASLLQDIGILALNEVAPEVMGTITRDAKDDHADLQALEEQNFGYDHAQIGSWVAESWQLPEEFQLAIKASHEPGEMKDVSGDQSTLIFCVALSGRFADLWCHSNMEKAVREMQTSAKDWLNLNPEDIGALLNRIPEGLSEIADFFQVHIGSAQEIDRTLHIIKACLAADSSGVVQTEVY